jgi:thymidylate synthase ThyX
VTKPSARVLLDSVSPAGHRVTTMEVVMHRFVLAEFNTHRAFSRNSASSRAIPVSKMIKQVMDDPAIPLKWSAEQRGMQGGETIERPGYALSVWLDARDNAVECASALVKTSVHKSVVNRLLEPFAWHTVIVTATGWDNFFTQRCTQYAQPEIRAVALLMHKSISASKPQLLDYGQWHTPLVTYAADHDLTDPWYSDVDVRKNVSAARCARVSYLTHDGRRDFKKDLELYDRLVSADPPHWSPLEHVCTPDPVLGTDQLLHDPTDSRWVTGSARPTNLRGWVQLRHVVEASR